MKINLSCLLLALSALAASPSFANKYWDCESSDKRYVLTAWFNQNGASSLDIDGLEVAMACVGSSSGFNCRSEQTPTYQTWVGYRDDGMGGYVQQESVDGLKKIADLACEVEDDGRK